MTISTKAMGDSSIDGGHPGQRRGLRAQDDAFTATGPGTAAGDYLRRFWQPVYHASDLAAGCAVPLTIIVKIVLDSTDDLRSLSVLLGDAAGAREAEKS